MLPNARQRFSPKLRCADGIIAQRRDRFQTHVPAALNRPFVVLFEQQRADETHDGVFVGEDADDVGAPLDLALERVDGVDFRLVILREGHEGQDISLGFIPERGKLWHLGTQPRGRLFLVERAGGRRAAEGVCEASKRSGRADDWQDLKGGRDEARWTDNAEDGQHRQRHLFNGHAVLWNQQ